MFRNISIIETLVMVGLFLIAAAGGITMMAGASPQGGQLPAAKLLLPSMGSTLARDTATAQTLLRQEKYVEAEKLIRRMVKQHADQPRPLFLLGYVLHVQKKYDAALDIYEQSRKNPQTKALSHYNRACIHAIQDRSDEAFEDLQAAIKAGFVDYGQIAADPDFAKIRSDPRFKKILPDMLPDSDLFAEPSRVIHKFVGEYAGDQFGWTARRAGDWDQDGVVDFVATAPTHRGRGKVYVYSSRTGEVLFQRAGRQGEQFGNSAVGCGDVDLDGKPDLIVGAPNDAAPGNAYVFSGLDGSTLHHFRGNHPGDKFGYEVSEVGDIDGDQHPDLLVGAAAANGKQARCGKVFIYSGETGKLLLELEGEQTGDYFGNAAATAENRDGTRTLAIGGQNAGEGNRGRVYVYRLDKGKADFAFAIDGDQNSINLGQMFISFPGDVDADGFPDVYASDFSDKTVVPGGGKIVVCSGRTGEQLYAITGQRRGEGLGTSPSDAGDVNGDGIGDLVIGAWQNNEGAKSGGKVYLYDGKTAELLRTWTSRQDGDTLGFDACGIGDVDGDGSVDFLLTSAWSNALGPKTGRVFIVSGSPASESDDATQDDAAEGDDAAKDDDAADAGQGDRGSKLSE